MNGENVTTIPETMTPAFDYTVLPANMCTVIRANTEEFTLHMNRSVQEYGQACVNVMNVHAALACVQELGFGAERLNRLYREMRHNYEQLNEWGKADGIEVAMEKLRRCACEALQTEEIVVENIDDEKTVQTLSRSYQAQEDEFLKRAVMMAAGRRAGKQGGAALPLSGDEVRRKIEAAKAQMDTGAYRRRG